MVDDVLALVGDARVVLLGEASHGTREFYELRAEITARLVAEHGFRGVAVEADWPAAARVNRYVQGGGDDPDAAAALGDFTRFPLWMWRNPVVAGLVERLRDLDLGAGFYGLDLYSLRESMDAVIAYLDERDPEAAARARDRYACFDHLDDHGYGRAVARGRKDPCEDAVVAQLAELRERAAELAAQPGRAGARRALRRRAERAPRRGRRALLPLRVPRPRQLLEPARHAHGRHARRAAGAPRRARGRLGPQLPRRGRPRLGDGLAARRAESRPARARAPLGRRAHRRLHDRPPAR
jgi:erythromycin esterase-like protein